MRQSGVQSAIRQFRSFVPTLLAQAANNIVQPNCLVYFVYISWPISYEQLVSGALILAKPPSRPRPPSSGRPKTGSRNAPGGKSPRPSGSGERKSGGERKGFGERTGSTAKSREGGNREAGSREGARSARIRDDKRSAPNRRPSDGQRGTEKRDQSRPVRRPRTDASAPRAVANPPKKPGEPQRIAKLLARAGIASRREIERMIAEGRIALDGKIIDTPATLLKSLHGVTVDGNAVKEPAPAKLFMFHKPAGCLTAERDPKGRKTIYDYLPKDMPRVIPVGRLDYNTEGMLLLTTDGELKRLLELPSTGVERSYRARAFGEISQTQLEDLVEGIEIDGVQYGKIDANLERRTGRNQWVEMTLTEGKNREVRRVLEHFGLEVSRLIRTRYGPFELTDMPVGAVDQVRTHDLITFRKSLTGSKSLTGKASQE